MLMLSEKHLPRCGPFVAGFIRVPETGCGVASSGTDGGTDQVYFATSQLGGNFCNLLELAFSSLGAQ